MAKCGKMRQGGNAPATVYTLSIVSMVFHLLYKYQHKSLWCCQQSWSISVLTASSHLLSPFGLCNLRALAWLLVIWKPHLCLANFLLPNTNQNLFAILIKIILLAKLLHSTKPLAAHKTSDVEEVMIFTCNGLVASSPGHLIQWLPCFFLG